MQWDPASLEQESGRVQLGDGARLACCLGVKTQTKANASPRKPRPRLSPGPHKRPDGGNAFLRDPTTDDPRMFSNDPLAEMLGEECVQAATSGEEAYSEDVDGMTTEEFGGPFTTFSVDADGVTEEPESPPALGLEEPSLAATSTRLPPGPRLQSGR